MNLLDILLVVPVAYGIWKGFEKGFVIELFTLLALLLGLYAGIHLSDAIAEVLKNAFDIQSEYLPTIVFTVIFLLIGAMVYFAGKTFEKVIKVVHLNLLNKLGGAVFGGAKMLFFVGAGLVILDSYDEKSDIISEETKQGSLLYLPLGSITTECIPALKRSTIFMRDALQESPEQLKEKVKASAKDRE